MSKKRRHSRAGKKATARGPVTSSAVHDAERAAAEDAKYRQAFTEHQQAQENAAANWLKGITGEEAQVAESFGTQDGDATRDSFVNFMQNMGVGADNPLSTAGYGFNPITRIRTMLEWIHRGSWLGGVAVDLVADDMTRAGVTQSGVAPEDAEQIETAVTALNVWNDVNDALKWARLYGGCLVVMLVDGQDVSTPFRLETVSKGQFKGLLVLDRWMVNPSLGDLVTEYGPHLGTPKFYDVTATAPALSGKRIHHTRCIRLEGIRLPYWQRVQENLWGISVLERLYDRMLAFDSASTGAAQLVYKSYIRTYKIKGLRQIIAQGGQPMAGLQQYVEMMRQFQGIEGLTLLDANDEFEATTNSAYGGLADTLQQFGQQLAGALQIPITRLFGQSPGGLDSSGESDLRTYYDNIKQQQERDLRTGLTLIYRATAASEGLQLEDGYKIEFNSLFEMNDQQKAETAGSVATAVGAAYNDGILDQATALEELRQSGQVTGIFTHITDEAIEQAKQGFGAPPSAATLLGGHAAPAAEPEATPRSEHSPALEEQGQDDPTVDRLPAVGLEHTNGLDAVTTLKRLHDLDVVLEHVRGDKRRGVEGKTAWEVSMPDHYGYLRQTDGADGDQLDCYVGPNPASDQVWIIDTRNPRTGLFDEHKVMLGYDSEPQVLKTFADGYTDGSVLRRLGTITPVTMDQFKEWLMKGDFMQPYSPTFRAGRAMSR